LLHGVLPPVLAADVSLLDIVKAAKESHLTTIGARQALRLERDKAINALLTWTSGFKQVLKSAFLTNPQHLEKVGIKVYTEGYVKKSTTPAEDPEPTDPGDPGDPGTTDPGDPGTTDPGEPGTAEPGDPGTSEPSA